MQTLTNYAINFKEGEFAFNSLGRWEIRLFDGSIYDIQNEEPCEIFVAGRWIKTRIVNYEGRYWPVDDGLYIFEKQRIRICKG